MDKLLLEELYYLMVLGRNFEYGAKEHYTQSNISGFLHLDIGQEALSIGSMKAFEKGDVFTTYREHVLALARGLEPKAIMTELFGKISSSPELLLTTLFRSVFLHYPLFKFINISLFYLFTSAVIFCLDVDMDTIIAIIWNHQYPLMSSKSDFDTIKM